MNEKKNWLLSMLAHEISDDSNEFEDYEKAKNFVYDFFKDDHINIIELYYINKKWTQALKIIFEDWKEGE